MFALCIKERTMVAKRLILLAVTLYLVALWGCSSTDSAGSDTYGSELQEEIFAAGFVGAALCVNCHQDFDWSRELTQGYLQGAHVIHSNQINAKSEGYCLGCHDPIGDGSLLEPYINPADVPAEGLAAVTCEVCHGTGAETDDEVGHWGIGPMPDPTPNFVVCGQCHNDELPESHLMQNPESGGIVEDYLASPHAESGNLNVAICVKCHNDEGGRLYRNVHTTAELYNQTFPVPGEVSPIQCRTCHDPHNTGELLLGEGEIELEFSGDVFEASAEYATCTTCHQPHNAVIFSDPDNLADVDPTDGFNGDLIYHGKRWNQVIAATHYDDPATAAFIEGYTMDPESERPCRDCHNVHAADITINLQWAESGHGGQIIIQKESAAAETGDPLLGTYQDVYNVKTAGVSGADYSWPDYDWDNTVDNGNCQRCHTATGLKNYLTDPHNYDLSGAANDFSNLEGWTASGGSGQNEMLYCWGCHADNTGTLRNAGNSLPLYDRNDELFATIPDIGRSTVCVACHGGVGNTETMINSGRTSRFQGHGPSRGALIFTDITHIGYEFAGLNYSSFYLHNKIGLNNDSPESGAGPCVSCHMPDENHTFAAAEYDAAGILTGVTNQTLCNTCHNSITESLVLLKQGKQGQNDSAALLGAYVTNTITNYLNNDVNTNYETVPLDAYGAFQNWKYFSEGDPCGYVHNAIYARRLIFDSIDWLDNGVLDGTITIPAEYPGARMWMYANNSGVAIRR